MRPYLAALYSALTNDGVIAGYVSDRISHGRGQAEDSFPYITFERLQLDDVAYDTGQTTIETGQILFHVFSTNDTTVAAVLDAIETLLKRTRLTLTVGTNLDNWKMSDGINEDPDRTEAGLTVWDGTMITGYRVQRSS